MDRRTALTRMSAGLAAGTAISAAPAATPPSARSGRLKLGCQVFPTTPDGVRTWQRYGVTHVCGCPEDLRPERGYWTVPELTKVQELCDKAGLVLAMMWEPFLRSKPVAEVDRPAVLLGTSPDRDRDIECFQKHIENCAAVGVTAVKYNFTLLGIPRTARTPGRGGASYSTWRLAEDADRGPTKAGRVPADAYWERIQYFLDRVLPVAEQYKVRLACHPQDPGVPPGYRGVDAVLGTVEGLRRFVGLKDSPYHGLNFCQGTVAEMLADPGKEIYDVIREFGRRGKIFNVHFRNIRGRRDDFQEVYPDEGDVDMWKAMLAYRDVGYDGMVMFDHIPDADDGDASRAFAYGYIRGLIHAAERSV